MDFLRGEAGAPRRQWSARHALRAEGFFSASQGKRTNGEHRDDAIAVLGVGTRYRSAIGSMRFAGSRRAGAASIGAPMRRA
jgi:hypothetical protein